MEKERNAVLTFEVAKQMYEGSDEQLKQLALSTFPELGKPSAEERFLKILNGCEIDISGTIITFSKNNYWLFQYNPKNRYFYCHRFRVWSPFESDHYNWNLFETLIKSMVEKHLGWDRIILEVATTKRNTINEQELKACCIIT